MDLKEYQKQAKRTCPSLGSDKLDLAHMVLGVYSEFEEYYNAKDDINAAEEVTDMFWYLANYCTFRGYELDLLFQDKIFNNLPFIVNISTLQDYIKKYIAYNKVIDKSKEYEVLKNIVYNVFHMYKDGSEIGKHLQNNIDKLRIRFPDKFDEHLAKNRNLEAERKELEK